MWDSRPLPEEASGHLAEHRARLTPYSLTRPWAPWPARRHRLKAGGPSLWGELLLVFFYEGFEVLLLCPLAPLTLGGIIQVSGRGMLVSAYTRHAM